MTEEESSGSQAQSLAKTAESVMKNVPYSVWANALLLLAFIYMAIWQDAKQFDKMLESYAKRTIHTQKFVERLGDQNEILRVIANSLAIRAGAQIRQQPQDPCSDEAIE